MNTYLVAFDRELVIKATTIKGTSGTAALDEALPLHMVGKVKRVRAWDAADFKLQRIIKKPGQYQIAGPCVGYKYHHPRIIKQ